MQVIIIQKTLTGKKNQPHNRRTELSKDNWETPDYFYELLNNEFHFTLDPCASDINHKTPKYFTKEQDGLKQDWRNESVFVNPPFDEKDLWIKKCYHEGNKENTQVVLIIPSTTDTQSWHNYIMKADEIRFCEGRVNFDHPRGWVEWANERLTSIKNELSEIRKNNLISEFNGNISQIKSLNKERMVIKKQLTKNSATFPLSVIIFRTPKETDNLRVESFSHKQNNDQNQRLDGFMEGD